VNERPPRDDREVPLHGGLANAGQVVRVGDTVRRPRRSWSPATHALLLHLEAVGFDGAPRFLGVDDQDREVLSYVSGTAITPPFPPWALTDGALESVADLLRDYHRAVSSFDPTSHEWPESPPAPFTGELVSHNDVNLDNVVFRDGRAVALIDFDLASPGCRVWDVACAARLWTPLRPDRYIDDARRGQVFALQDTVFNVAFIGAVAAAATVIAPDGRSVPLALLGAAVYVLGLLAATCNRRVRNG